MKLNVSLFPSQDSAHLLVLIRLCCELTEVSDHMQCEQQHQASHLFTVQVLPRSSDWTPQTVIGLFCPRLSVNELPNLKRFDGEKI